MQTSRRLALATGLALLLLPATARAAEVLYGVTDANTLVTFHSDSPGALRAAVPLTGLQEGERAIAIDVRPKTGQLTLLGSTSRLYTVNPTSGAAVALGGAFSPALAGANFGLDVNPVDDRARVVSDGRQNIRLNPEDGQVAGQDATLAYADGDAGAGTTPSFTAAAYNADGALVVIDTARDVLTTSAAPNDGKFTTVGPLGADLQEPAEMDFAADGRAWVVARRPGTAAELWALDAATGALRPGARLPGVSTLSGTVRGIAAAGPVPDDRTRPALLVSVNRRQTLKALRRVRFDASCSEACAITAALRKGKRRLARGEGALARAGKLRVRAVDAAGNRTKLRRRVRFG